MQSNRSGLWALLGVMIGFGLPVLACVAVGVLAAAGAGLLALTSEPVELQPVHLSGPLAGPAIAIIDVAGPIVSGRAAPFDNEVVAYSGDIVPLIERAGADSTVHALVLRVNSPGGSVVPSDEIYYALRQVDKPIVVIMGDVAASGAYYISMAADHIVANPNTLTGSIGVISQFPNAAELLEKLGVEFTVIKSGKSKDIGSPWREMSPREQTLWQEIIDGTYDNFVEIVVAGRDLSEKEVRKVADGRVFTGEQALALGLIDSLGYETDAIQEAADLAGIDGEPRVVHYQRPTSFLSALGGRIASQSLALPGVPSGWFQRLLFPSLEYRWAP